MDAKKIEQLFELIREVISEPRPWTEKRDKLLAEASDDDKTNVAEFAAWFE